MNKVELDVIQNEEGQFIVIDQDGRRIDKVKSIEVNQSLEGVNTVTVTFLQVRKGDVVTGRNVRY